MPFANEHACELRDSAQFDEFRRGSRQHEGKVYGVLYGRPKAGGGWQEVSYRYPAAEWTAAEGQSHCKSHDGHFVAASGKMCPPNPPVSGHADAAAAEPDDDLLYFDMAALLPDELAIDPEDFQAALRECAEAVVHDVVSARFRALTGRLD